MASDADEKRTVVSVVSKQPRKPVFSSTTEDVEEGTHIALKFRGTAADHTDMITMGHKQVLKRNFGLLTTIGFASTVIVSWEVMLPFINFFLTDGGPPLLFWGSIACSIGMTLVYASIAEIASMSPTAGGQYHWVSEFSPPKIQKFLSYTTGWLTAIAWQVYLASVCFAVGTMIQALIILNKPDYVSQPWHGTMLSIGMVSGGIVFNTALAEHLPTLQYPVLIFHVLGLFAIIIPLWVTAPITPPHKALFEFTNHGGWPTTGISAMIGLISPISAICGYDCSVHMAEEIQDASLNLPRAIMWSTVVNATMAFVMAVTLVFTLGDVDGLLATRTPQLFVPLIYNATQSYTGTNVMVIMVIILFFACCVNETATASRQIWAFSRDQGLPFSNWLAKVTPGWDVPLRAVGVSLVATSLLSCINLGSTTALYAMTSLGVCAVLVSYMITIGCIINRRINGPPLPARRWSLGRFGLVINIAAAAFLVPVWFFMLWPLTTPVTAMNMNWGPVVFVGVLIVAMLHYVVRGKQYYSGPVIHVKRDQ